MLKRFGLLIIALLILALVLWFTSLNPDTVTIDLAFGVVEPSLSLALAVTFVLGWLFGLGCVSFLLLRLAAERRRLRSELDSTRTEVSSLRSLPIADAD